MLGARWFVAPALAVALVGCGGGSDALPDGGGPNPDGGGSGLAAPQNVAASDGTTTFHVEVTWSAVAGATGYRVWRDGLVVGDSASPIYVDTTADAAGAPAAPTAVIASTDLDDRVHVTWEAVAPPLGTMHSYTVTAVDSDDGDSAPSAADSGYRAALPVTGYAIAIDDGVFVEVGDVTSFDDLSAPAGVIASAGAAAASQGSSLVSVTLSLSGVVLGPATRMYAVRAINGAGTGATSTPTTGSRSIANAGPLSYQWERSASDSDADYAALAGATTAVTSDNALGGGAARWYRCRVSLAGVPDAFSTGVRGWIANNPTVPRSDTWHTNSAVFDMARVNGGTLVVGTFTYVGPPTGSGVFVNASTGVVDPSTPRIDTGSIREAISDGNGGWYIAGSFTYVGGVLRPRLVHLTATGAVDSAFDAAITTGVVQALALSGGTLYVGGTFTQVGGQTRNNLAAVDRVTGAVTAWNPDANLTVRTLAVRGTTVYAGGDFYLIGSRTKSNFAPIDMVTGIAASGHAANGAVDELVFVGDVLYAAGTFTSIGGQPRNHLAAIDTTNVNFTATAWNPDVGSANIMTVWAMVIANGSAYLGGDFTTVGGQPRRGFAAVDLATGAVTAWDPSAQSTGLVAGYGLAIDDGVVYAAGVFRQLGGAPRNYIAALDATTGLATAWNPNCGERTDVIAVQGNVVFIGGDFSSVGGVDRRGLAVIDDATGAATAWNPGGDGSALAIAVSGNTVYTGGTFTTIGGQPRNNLAAIDLTTGSATTWNPDVDGTVSALALAGGDVYAGGTFTHVGTASRRYLAAIDVASGSATAWTPEPDNWISELLVDGGTLYAGGYFGTIAATARGRAAAFDIATGSLRAWDPAVASGGVVRAFAVANGRVYLGGAFTAVGGQLHKCVAAVDATTGAPTTWDPSVTTCGVDTMAVSGSTIYLGGGFFDIAGVSRPRLANVDLTTGALSAWNPAAEIGNVNKVLLDGNRVIVGGGFRVIDGRLRSGLAIFEP